MKKFILGIILGSLLTSGISYAYRAPKPQRITDFDENNLVILNETLEQLWDVTNGRYVDLGNKEDGVDYTFTFRGKDNEGVITWMEDEDYFRFEDDLVFNTGAGLAYGEIWMKDNTDAVTLNSAAEVQIVNFDTNGESNNMTPDHTQDYIEIDIAGIYLVTVSIHVNNNAAQSHVIDVSAFKNNGSKTEIENIHSHRALTGGSGDVGSMSMSGIASCSAGDKFEIWATTDSGDDRSVTFSDITLSIVQIGG